MFSISSGPFISFYEESMQMKFFGIGLYSHVGFGRYMGFVFLVSLINLIYTGYFRKFHIDKIFFLVSFAGLIISGLRGAILSSIVIAIIITIYSLKKKNVSALRIISFIGAAVLLVSAAVYFNHSFSILFYRFTQVYNIFHLELLSDGPIQTRVHVYLNSFEIFMQNVVSGRGLGGYYDESLFSNTKGLKYPHNIFIEYAIELGVIGLIFISAVFIMIYRAVLKVNTLLAFIFLYFVLLAMFSYSIPFQTGLFSFMAFISLRKHLQLTINN